MGNFGHCRWYAVLTLLVLNVIPTAVIAESGTVTVTGQVNGSCGSGAVQPAITSPAPGTHLSNVSITVSGTAKPGDTITVTRNGSDAGSTVVVSGGQWSLPLSLVTGTNTLVAAACLESNPVIVELGVTTQPAPNQDVKASDPPWLAAPKGTELGSRSATVTLRYAPRSGQAPYDVTVDWGDGTTDAARRTDQETVTLSHRYVETGTFRGTVRAIDRNGRQAELGFVARPLADPAGGMGGTIPLLQLILLELLLVAAVFAGWEYYHQRHLKRDRDCPQPGTAP